MEVLHRAESGFYRLAKVVEEAGEGESKKVLVQDFRIWCPRDRGIFGLKIGLKIGCLPGRQTSQAMTFVDVEVLENQTGAFL